MFPSVTQLLATVLQAQFPTLRVCTELPGNLEAVLATTDAVVQLRRFGGNEHVLTMDAAFIDVDFWATTLDGAETVAAQVVSWMRLYLPGHSATGPSGSGTFAKAHVQTSPMRRPAGNLDVRRVGAALTVYVHSA